MNTVCAIVPTFNRRAMLYQCLQSLLSAERPPDRIVVVDDGSTDNTADMVRSRFGNRVELLEQRNGGKSSALNRALAQCGQDWVWLCDDDDLAAAGGLAALAGALADAPSQIGFAYGHHRLFRQEEDGGVTVGPPAFWASADEPDIRISAAEDNHVFQFATLFRRSALEQAGPFREDLSRSQDLDMLLRVTERHGGRYVPATIFYQRDHGGPRGPARAQGEEGRRYHRWLECDRRFFPALAGSPRDFTPSFARTEPPAVQVRAAALQRGVVFARRGLWEEALCALRQAALVGGEAVPMPAELRLAGRVARHGLPADVLPRGSSALRNLAAPARLSPYGALVMASAAATYARYARDALRGGRPGDAVAQARMALALAPPAALAREIARRLRARRLPPEPAPGAAARNTVTTGEREELARLLAVTAPL